MKLIVHSHLIKFLESNKTLSDLQHGFWKRGSSLTLVITTIHGLAVGLDRRQQVLMQFCWMSARLLKRFHIAWQSRSITMAPETRTYPRSKVLADRNRQVVLEWKTSSPAAVTSGVPQGTVFRPLLILVCT